jgi:hypothetical protein
MKGDQPHAGFPEKNYEAHGERLARAGHRTVIIEQTETPDALEARKKATGAKDKVVRREKVALLSRGTLTDATMLAATPDAAYLVAITEAPVAGAGADDDADADAVVIGLCAADCATGRLLLGGWRDDGARSRLRAALAELRPVEAVLPRGALTGATLGALRAAPRPPVERLLPPGGDGFWDAQRTLAELEKGGYYGEGGGGGGGGAGPSGSSAAAAAPRRHPPPPGAPRAGRFAGWPPALAAAAEGGAPCPGVAAPSAASAASAAAALSAFGGVVRHLRDSLIDHDILCLGQVAWLPGADDADAGAHDDGHSAGAAAAAAASWAARGAVALDGAALEALEVLENSEGGAAGSLLAAVDRCACGAGRRRLRAWLCRPLRDAAAVAARQAAVADLKSVAADAVGAARRALRGSPDLERAVGAPIHPPFLFLRCTFLFAPFPAHIAYLTPHFRALCPVLFSAAPQRGWLLRRAGAGATPRTWCCTKTPPASASAPCSPACAARAPSPPPPPRSTPAATACAATTCARSSRKAAPRQTLMMTMTIRMRTRMTLWMRMAALLAPRRRRRAARTASRACRPSPLRWRRLRLRSIGTRRRSAGAWTCARARTRRWTPRRRPAPRRSARCASGWRSSAPR